MKSRAGYGKTLRNIEDRPSKGTRFKELGYDVRDPIAGKIISLVVDRFYGLLDKIRSSHRIVQVIGVRGCCSGHWHNELHPNKPAAVRIAIKFLKEIEDLASVA